MRILVTGGAGFIGSHTALHFAEKHQVRIVDNLSREGSRKNWEWLEAQRDLELIEKDVRDSDAMDAAVRDFRPDAIIHLAGQVAVTTSVSDPRTDFEINALGTFNVLEAARKHVPDCAFLYSSTNKVYGEMTGHATYRDGKRYKYRDLPFGADEHTPLAFHSPYGCSKGTADQYVHDYFSIYGQPTVVFRQSCCYGTRQFGVEDQGWIAWFTICNVFGKKVTVYGDGAQVRDILWVEDLVRAYDAAIHRIGSVAGSVYNLGGGVDSQLSLLELLDQLEVLSGQPVEYDFGDWRSGDQKVFVADTRKAQAELGWQTSIHPAEGVKRLYEWVTANRELFAKLDIWRSMAAKAADQPNTFAKAWDRKTSNPETLRI